MTAQFFLNMSRGGFLALAVGGAAACGLLALGVTLFVMHRKNNKGE